MDVFGKDAILGEIKLSDMGMMLASFDSKSSDEEDLSMGTSTIEEYIGDNPVPIYIGMKHNAKLQESITMVKNPCLSKSNYFDEYDCRKILRCLTGFRGYKRLQILTEDFETTYHFNFRTIDAKYQKVEGQVAGITLEIECDSPFAWTDERQYKTTTDGSSNIVIYNQSDDLNHYLLPLVTLSSPADVDLSIINLNDHGWETKISLLGGETVTMDSKRSMIFSNNNRLIGKDFNQHFIRFVPDKNEFSVNHAVDITFQYNLPIKVGFL